MSLIVQTEANICVKLKIVIAIKQNSFLGKYGHSKSFTN